MRAHWSHRLMASITTVLFLFLTLGQGEAAHVCPAHEPLLAEAMAAGGLDGARSLAAAATHEHMAAGSHANHGQGTDHQHARCCCTGLACVTAAITLPAVGTPLPAARIFTPVPPPLPEYARMPAAPAYFIPFANGPPALSARPA